MHTVGGSLFTFVPVVPVVSAHGQTDVFLLRCSRDASRILNSVRCFFNSSFLSFRSTVFFSRVLFPVFPTVVPPWTISCLLDTVYVFIVTARHGTAPRTCSRDAALAINKASYAEEPVSAVSLNIAYVDTVYTPPTYESIEN